ncbi:MAG: methylmalonyl Co-A mutase-associated GTPase MeaB [Rhodospirillales bacterium]
MARPTPSDSETPASLAAAVRSGDRRALARAITLVESTRADHRSQADALLAELLPHTGKSMRLGITGVPGVGKSTLIERFGLHLIAGGHRLAVLAVDPSSKVSGGSILGDKTRMEELSRHPDAFIRPTPAGTTLGGVARRTREVILLAEAAGFDVVIVETVGVGQSETTVSEMVDMFILLLLPSGGDDLQGIKKGVVELADLVVVNKADGDMKAAATRAASDYSHALHLLRQPTPGWTVEVRTCSALTGDGIGELWDAVERFGAAVGGKGIERRRADQARAWLWNELGETLLQRLRSDQTVRRRLPALEAAVTAGTITPGIAAAELLALFTKASN